MVRDLTERKAAEAALEKSKQQLLQAQKMEAIGRLAGGVAHDFNNLLSVIVGYSSVALEHPGLSDAARSAVEQVLQAGERATSLTRHLLAFSRQQVLQPRVLDLNDVLASMEKMVKRLIGEDIELVFLLGTPLWRVKVDPGQIEQVLMNLVVNSRDAMPQGGQLTIETRNVDLDERYATEHVGTSPGPHVVLMVSDTGCGMDAATRSRVFEPFFTTKEQGKGTGLGLSTVHGIVQQSGGSIWLYSEPGLGTTFKIYLPAVPEGVRSPQESERDDPASLFGSETILLVEDDPPLRTLARTLLERRGYQVLAAGSAQEALRLSEGHAGPIHLLLTDVVMPQMSGRVLAEKLGPLRPEMRVLYMSGYTDDAVVRHGILHSEVAFLQKPISSAALLRKVRDTLDAGRTE
jgi:nitrogen-specific signal transduction histidine kinase/ActR/RegA family two-component response regulator